VRAGGGGLSSLASAAAERVTQDSEAAVHRAVERAVDLATVLTGASEDRAVTGGPDVDEVLAAIARVAVDILETDLVAVARRREIDRAIDDHERIAMDLHDGVVQTLFAASLTIESIAEGSSLGPQAGAVRAQLLAAAGTIDRAIADLRRCIGGLRSPEPAGAVRLITLHEDLRRLVESFRGSGATRVTADIDDRAASLLQGLADDVLQAAREALANAVRHASATTVQVVLRLGPDDAVLEVSDDGCGFDADTVAPGRGLANLRARARSVGGVFELLAKPGQGTTVRIAIPA